MEMVVKYKIENISIEELSHLLSDVEVKIHTHFCYH